MLRNGLEGKLRRYRVQGTMILVLIGLITTRSRQMHQSEDVVVHRSFGNPIERLEILVMMNGHDRYDIGKMLLQIQSSGMTEPFSALLENIYAATMTALGAWACNGFFCFISVSSNANLS
jgi:hypothetical protein